MSEYVVSCDALELPRGSYFTVFPRAEVLPGQLCLFDLAGWLIPGRLYPGEIQLPGHRIDISKVAHRVVGPVVPIELTAKTITNLPKAEYEQFLESSFPRWLDS